MCHIKSNFHDMHISLTITREEDHKHARLKVEHGVRLAFESRHRTEEKNIRLEGEEEAQLVEEARLKAEKAEQAQLRADK